jgi:SpoVK/Ycf46/Vps4 family AAA+-type ATPase
MNIITYYKNGKLENIEISMDKIKNNFCSDKFYDNILNAVNQALTSNDPDVRLAVLRAIKFDLTYKQKKTDYSMIIKGKEEIKKEPEVAAEEKLYDINHYMKLIEEPMIKLNNLVGLDDVKNEVVKLVNYIIYRESTKEYLNHQPLNLNMIFSGNPGTGKTTVATILADILCKLGYLKRNKVSIIGSHDLIGEYVGHTAQKTEKLLRENKGGVIILDEAYTLASEGQKFKDDALGVILKEMEKRDTVFIFVGYEKEMKRFVDMNSGIISRIGLSINFKDYSVDQLFEMLLNKIERMNKNLDSECKLHFSDDAVVLVKKLIEQAIQDENFGNARYIDNLADAILREKANTISNCNSKEELLTIYPENIPYIQKKVKTKVIGFMTENK